MLKYLEMNAKNIVVLFLSFIHTGAFCCKSNALEINQLPPHPRLLFTAKELPQIKQRISEHQWASANFKSLKHNADEWLKINVKLPDRGGQWYHYYSCPKHGARLRTESPTKHVCPVDGEVFSGYPYDDVYIMSEHNKYANALKTLGIVYQLTGQKNYADKAREILLAYAAKYPEYPLHTIRNEARIGGGKVGPQTLDESTWLITVVEGADCIWDTLTEDQKGSVINGLLLPATDIIRKHKMGIHNIQCWKNSAVGLVGLLINNAEMIKEAIEGESGYFNQMKKGVMPDGVWYEGAWGYHFYTISALVHLTEAARNCGINLYGEELRRMFEAPILMAMPNLELPAFNDSYTVQLPTMASLYEIAFSRYNDRRFALVMQQGNRINNNAMLYGRPIDSAKINIPVASVNFPSSGYGILAYGTSTDATWFCIDYGPHGGGHGHPDKLGFVLYGLGQPLSVDPGTANYGVPIQANWYRTTIAHNTLCVDETSQKPAEGKCLAFVADKDFSAILTDAGNIYDDIKFYRASALIEGKVLVMIDNVSSSRNHIFDIAYHPKGKFVAQYGQMLNELSKKQGYNKLRDIRLFSTNGIVSFSFRTKDGKETVWVSKSTENTDYITGTGVGKHTEDRVPIIIARRKTNSTIFNWAVVLDKSLMDRKNFLEGVSIKGLPENSAVKVKYNAKEHIIVANPTGMEFDVAGRKYSNIMAHFVITNSNKIVPAHLSSPR